MTIKYALRKETPESEIRKDRWSKVLNRFMITSVSKELAENDEDGVYAVYNNDDVKISAWIYIANDELQNNLRRIKPGKPLPDRMGTILQVGDYVLTTIDSSHYLCLARVVGFTPQFVRIEDLQRNWTYLAAKSPDHLIKVSNDVISPEGTRHHVS